MINNIPLSSISSIFTSIYRLTYSIYQHHEQAQLNKKKYSGLIDDIQLLTDMVYQIHYKNDSSFFNALFVKELKLLEQTFKDCEHFIKKFHATTHKHTSSIALSHLFHASEAKEEYKILRDKVASNKQSLQLAISIQHLVSYTQDQVENRQREENHQTYIEYLFAAQNGNVKAQYNLGEIYLKGALGKAPDPDKAIHYFKLAANQKLGIAQCALGECYLRGIGVTQDFNNAFNCYKDAAKQLLATGKISNTEHDTLIAQLASQLAADNATMSATLQRPPTLLPI